VRESERKRGRGREGEKELFFESNVIKMELLFVNFQQATTVREKGLFVSKK
jgi:hypothetical protein